MPLLVGVLVVALVIYYFASRGDVHGGDNTADAEAELLHLCLGNAEQAERLIALEMKKRPGLQRREAARRAVHGLRRDV